MVGVLVVTVRGIQRDAGGLLTRKAGFGGALIGMYLDGERLGGAQHLEQKRQLAKAAGDGIAQLSAWIGGDVIAQALLGAVRILHPRAVQRVGPHPQLGHRLVIGVSDAIEVTQRVVAAPGIVLYGIDHLLHLSVPRVSET